MIWYRIWKSSPMANITWRWHCKRLLSSQFHKPIHYTCAVLWARQRKHCQMKQSLTHTRTIHKKWLHFIRSIACDGIVFQFQIDPISCGVYYITRQSNRFTQNHLQYIQRQPHKRALVSCFLWLTRIMSILRLIRGLCKCIQKFHSNARFSTANVLDIWREVLFWARAAQRFGCVEGTHLPGVCCNADKTVINIHFFHLHIKCRSKSAIELDARFRRCPRCATKNVCHLRLRIYCWGADS